MTPAQEKHLKLLKQQAQKLIESKYRAGQKEHGGNLFDLSPAQLVDEAILEAVDQFVYLITLKQKLNAKIKLTFKARK